MSAKRKKIVVLLVTAVLLVFLIILAVNLIQSLKEYMMHRENSVVDLQGSVSINSKLVIQTTEKQLTLGESWLIDVQLTHKDVTLPWEYESSASDIVFVEQNITIGESGPVANGFIVKGVGVGEAIVTLRYDGMEANCKIKVNPISSPTADKDVVPYTSNDFYLMPSEFAYNEASMGEYGGIKFLAHVDTTFYQNVVSAGGVFKMLLAPIDEVQKISSMTAVVDWVVEFSKNEELTLGRNYEILNCSEEQGLNEMLLRTYLIRIKMLNTNRVIVAIPYAEFGEKSVRQYAFVPYGESFLTYASSYAYVCSKALYTGSTISGNSYSEIALDECNRALMVSANITAGIFNGYENADESVLESLLNKRLIYKHQIVDIVSNQELLDRPFTVMIPGQRLNVAVRFVVMNTLTDEIYDNGGNRFDVLLYYKVLLENGTTFRYENGELIAPDAVINGTEIFVIRAYFRDGSKIACFECVDNSF